MYRLQVPDVHNCCHKHLKLKEGEGNDWTNIETKLHQR